MLPIFARMWFGVENLMDLFCTKKVKPNKLDVAIIENLPYLLPTKIDVTHVDSLVNPHPTKSVKLSMIVKDVHRFELLICRPNPNP